MNPEQLIGRTLDHYRILRQIGYGGMAAVFLAEDTNLEREVAVKVFWPRPGETRDFLRRFAREARVLAQLNHPNILSIYDYGEADGNAYLVTPYLPGGTLKDLLKERKILSPIETLQLAAQMLDALQYAHERGLIHRDIKPGNMLFKADGSLVLADFGLVKVTSPDATSGEPLDFTSQTGSGITGTPEYMSPEQIEGKAYLASDIYSLGIVLYEMLTGRRPFQADTTVGLLMQQMHERPRPMRESNPSLSMQLDAVVLRALEKGPDRRFARPVDFLQALTQATSQGAASNAGLRQLNEPTIPTTWTGPQPPSQDMPLISQGVQGLYRQGQPGGQGQDTRYPAILSNQAAQRGPITDAGQLHQAGVSMPITPERYFPGNPAHGALGQISSVPPQQAPHGRQPRSRGAVLALVLSLIVIAGLVTGLVLTVTGHTPFVLTGQTPGARGSVTVTQTATPTLSCPATGTARAAVVAPLKSGGAQNIVYSINQGTLTAPTDGLLMRYDTATGQQTQILKMAKARFDNAQISNDGQWILYSAHVQGQAELGMVRMDGSMAQTLYCAPGVNQITLPQWSLDQKQVVFDLTPQSGGATLYLLKMATGAFATELTPPGSGLAYLPRTWLDFTRVLLIGYYPNSASPQQNIYILDTSKGANQQSSNLQSLATVGTQQNTCWDFDSSFDGKTAFISQCAENSNGGSSTVEAQQTTGGTAHSTVFSSSTLAITSVRVFEKTGAFLLATTTTGLYKITLDGSNNATQLASVSQGTVGLNGYSQYFWSNVSRDGTMYALEDYTPGQNTAYTLLYGSMNGGQAQSFASVSDGTEMEVVGWTTM